MATIGVKVELEGTKEFNTGMKNLKEQTKLFDTQLKNLDSTMKGQSAFSKAIQEHELLKGKMEALTKESELLQQRIQESSDKFGENDTRTLALKNQYEKLKGEIALTNEALSNNNGLFTALSAELDEVGKKLQDVGSKITGIGNNLTKSVTGPIAALGAASVKVASSFEDSMAQVAATMGFSVEELHDETSTASKTMEELGEFAKSMGETTVFSASEAADAMNYMALAGYDAETTMAMLPNVLNLAAAGGIDLAYASDMVTDSQSALGLSLDETSELVDKMARASSKSNTSVAQLGEAILTVGGTAQNLAGGTTELSTALGLLADNGVKGSEGGTALRNMILSLAAPTDNAAIALNQLGVEVFDQEGNMRELNAIFGDMGKALDELTQEDRTQALNLIFNKVDLKSVNALLNTSAQRWEELAGSIDDAEGAAQTMADVQLDTFSGQLKLIQSQLEGVGIKIGKIILPHLKNLATSISTLVDKFSKLSQSQQKQIVMIAGIAAAVGPLLVVIGKVITAIGSIFTAVSGLITFVVANPVLAGITVALGLAVVAAVAFKEATDDVSDSVELQAQRLEEAKTSAENYNKQMDQFVQNNQGIVDSIDLQYQAEQNLVTELQSIVDENGNVKQGYEERAQVITQQLGEAFGIEIEMQGNVIQNYQDTLSLIDQVIEKKKAEALIAAGQQEYINALQDQKTKYEELKTAEENLSTETDRYNGLVDEATAALKRYDEETANGNYDAANDAYVAWEQLTNQAEEQKKAVDDATESYRLYAEQFYQNQAVIENYDNLQKALTDGTTNLDGAITQFTENLVTNAPIDYLRTQAEDAKTYYEELLEDFNSGEVAISESQLQAAQTNAEEAQKILTEAVEAYRTQGLAAGAGYGEGLSESNKNILSTIDDVIGNALAEVAKIQETGSPAQKYIEQGEYAGQGYAKGLENSKDIIETAMGTITTLLDTFELNTGTTISTGLLSNETAVKTSMTNIITQLGLDFETIETTQGTFMDNIDTKNTDTFTHIFDTVKEKMGNVLTEVTTDCTQIESEFTYLVNNSEQWGSDFIGNFESGIVSRMQSLLDTVKRMAEEIASYMHFSTPDQGPLKDADKWMPDFMKLLAQGIDTNKYLVENAVKGLSFDMAELMGNPFDVDEIYRSVRAGASDATTELYLNGRELTRGLKELGVQFNG